MRPGMPSTRCLISLVVAIGLSACASAPELPSPETRGQLGRIYLQAIQSTPRAEFDTFAKSRAEGALKGGSIGAGEGLLYALAQGARSSGGGPYAAAATAISAVLFSLVGVVVQGTEGARSAVSGDVAQQVEAQMSSVLADLDLSLELSRALYAESLDRPELARYGIATADGYAADRSAPYESLAARGFDTVAEIQVTEAGFQGGSGAQPRIRFYLSAHVALVDTHSGMHRLGRDFRYSSEALPYQQWFLEGASKLALGFQQAQSALAARLLDELLLVTKFPFPSGAWALPGSPEYGACWFKTIYPVTRYSSLWYSMRHNKAGISVLYEQVDTLNPRLQWEPFPRPRDRTSENQALIGQIRDVSYDLKIWEAPNDAPYRLIYDLTGLEQAEYTPEFPLTPGGKYFWTVRARYDLSGAAQASRWAFSMIPAGSEGNMPIDPCDLEEIPAANYYRFTTPP